MHFRACLFIALHSAERDRWSSSAVSLACSAKIFNLYPQKGAILEGSDADMIILDPEETTVISAATHHSRIDTNVYEGWKIEVRFMYRIQYCTAEDCCALQFSFRMQRHVYEG